MEKEDVNTLSLKILTIGYTGYNRIYTILYNSSKEALLGRTHLNVFRAYVYGKML